MKNSKNKKIIKSITELRQTPSFKRDIQDIRARIELSVEIYNARSQRGLSQTKLAELANTTQRIISNIESAQVNVGFDLIRRVVKALDLTFKIGAVDFGNNNFDLIPKNGF
ncbi:MAG TPA: helix-turn-helix transcriptional regulator, partial [Candidatus Nanoarchaeia archaeon]|nr:helix-turn-helix transcriptional regulator [Candidatus Nanoarchaeia archaeon]